MLAAAMAFAIAGDVLAKGATLYSIVDGMDRCWEFDYAAKEVAKVMGAVLVDAVLSCIISGAFKAAKLAKPRKPTIKRSMRHPKAKPGGKKGESNRPKEDSKGAPAPKPKPAPGGLRSRARALSDAELKQQIKSTPKDNDPSSWANELRYERYRRQGGERNFDDWFKGSRGGRSGTKAHQDDVLRNNDANDLQPMDIGNGLTPDGVGKPGQTVTIRGQAIKPKGNGRVLVESDRTVFNGRFPESSARVQIRNYRKANPKATIVVTDPDRPGLAPLVYPPGTQPPPPGVIGRNHATHVPYP